MKVWASASVRGLHDLLVGGVGAAVGEVLADGALEQEHVLGHEPDRSPQRPEGEVLERVRRRA